MAQLSFIYRDFGKTLNYDGPRFGLREREGNNGVGSNHHHEDNRTTYILPAGGAKCAEREREIGSGGEESWMIGPRRDGHSIAVVNYHSSGFIILSKPS